MRRLVTSRLIWIYTVCKVICVGLQGLKKISCFFPGEKNVHNTRKVLRGQSLTSKCG